MRSIILIAHNLRSSHNIGSLLRTADGLGIHMVYLTGYTPHPTIENDTRLPHESLKTTKQISKTALGAETTQPWQYHESVESVISLLKKSGYDVFALEQTKDSVDMTKLKPSDKIAILVGREVEGVEPDVLAMCDGILEIPMYGSKESFNVVQAAAMALYECRFSDRQKPS